MSLRSESLSNQGFAGEYSSAKSRLEKKAYPESLKYKLKGGRCREKRPKALPTVDHGTKQKGFPESLMPGEGIFRRRNLESEGASGYRSPSPRETVNDKTGIPEKKPKSEWLRVTEYYGTTPWEEFATEFGAASDYNGWDEQQKVEQLLKALKGAIRSTITVLLEDNSGDPRSDFQRLYDRLEERFGTKKERREFEDLMNLALKERIDGLKTMQELLATQESNLDSMMTEKSLADELVERAMTVRETLARRVSIAIHEIRTTLSQIRELCMLNQFQLPRNHPSRGVYTESIGKINEKLAMMRNEQSLIDSVVNSTLNSVGNGRLPTEATNRRRNVQCYRCGDFGHIQRFCKYNSEINKHADGRESNADNNNSQPNLVQNGKNRNWKHHQVLRVLPCPDRLREPPKVRSIGKCRKEDNSKNLPLAGKSVSDFKHQAKVVTEDWIKQYPIRIWPIGGGNGMKG